MIRHFLFSAVLLCSLLAKAQEPAIYVNPMVGTGGHGHTFPGATTPYGMVQLSPDTRIDNSWDGCSGYHYSDSLIYGFSHTHLNGTGCSDYGDIAVLPFTAYTAGENDHKAKFDYRHYAASFSHANEKASAGYYSVQLNNHISAELTATTRVGIHRYIFPSDEDCRVVVQLDHRDKTIESKLVIVNNRRIEGFRRSEAWARDQYIYFVMEFSEPFAAELGETAKTDKGLQNAMYQILSFGRLNEKPLLVKTGISNVSMEGAAKNLAAEAKHDDFEKYKAGAEASWNKELSKIRVYTKNKEELHVFYTALYHTMMQPNMAMDVDSLYRGRDNQVHKTKGFGYYTVFSLWDTHRAAHPLYTLIDRKRTADFINTFITEYEQGGRLPMWELSSNETDCMIGYHSVSVIADAYIKGIGGFDMARAYPAMIAAASYTDMGIPRFNQNNYLRVDDESESVSKTLEYAYDDWCIAQAANKLGKKADYLAYMKKAQAYKNVFDKEVGFMRPRKNGNWLSPFDAREVNNHYTEANAWQYTFFVPQDVDGLIKEMGGDRAFEAKLDELFTTSTATTGREQADITGLIGQYAHGNEPSHHMAYLYNYVGRPYKTQEKVTKILAEFYKNTPDGLIGNEDCGQMSAWYVLSSMGFYQVCPGAQEFIIGKPLFDSVAVQLENGKTFRIRKQGKGDYVSGLHIDGRKSMHTGINYSTIMMGGSLVFDMSPGMDSASAYGKSYISRPVHKPAAAPVVFVPLIRFGNRVFEDQDTISLQSPDAAVQLYYTLDGTEPTRRSALYDKPFVCSATTTIKAKAYSPTDSSASNVAMVYKRPNHWALTLNSTYNRQYTAGGKDGLIDGIRGAVNWRKGDWQGYQGQDFEAIIDLGQSQPIKGYKAGFLQDSRAWILFPTKVEFYVSQDGKTYELMESVANTVKAEDNTVQIHEFEKQSKKNYAGRYVKVKAYNFGKLPAWHQGAGGDAFIFIDEIEVK